MWLAVGCLSFPTLMVSPVLELFIGHHMWGQGALDNF